MKRGLKGFAFLVSGLVLGIIGATVSATAIALSAVGMAIPMWLLSLSG